MRLVPSLLALGSAEGRGSGPRTVGPASPIPPAAGHARRPIHTHSDTMFFGDTDTRIERANLGLFYLHKRYILQLPLQKFDIILCVQHFCFKVKLRKIYKLFKNNKSHRASKYVILIKN